MTCRSRPGTRSAVVAVMAALLVAAPALEAVTAAAAPRSAGAVSAKKQRQVRRFVRQLARAIRMGDGDFLFEHLHPEVLERYGENTCRARTDALEDATAQLRVRRVKAAGLYEWETDGLTTDVPKVFPVVVDQTLGGQDERRTIHVTTKEWFTDCGDPAGALVQALKELEGTYRGRWTNTTFGSSGGAEATLAVDTATARLTLGLTGNVFGGAAPPPETFEIPLGSVQQGQPVQASSTLFGPVTATFQADGSLLIEANDVPAPGITTFRMVVTMANGAVEADYTVGFDGGGSAEGTATLTKA